jgi:hypothetical protein
MVCDVDGLCRMGVDMLHLRRRSHVPRRSALGVNAKSRRRCGRGEPSPGADVAGVKPAAGVAGVGTHALI